MSYYLLLLGLFGVGLGAVLLGIILRLGKFRQMYTGRSIPVYAQREVFHISIPIGLTNIIVGLMILRPDIKDPLTYPLAFSFFATMILAIWQPWWLRPAWLRWLENNYGHVLEKMFAEARAMGRREWAEQVKTQEGLEQWADSVAKKHGWQRRQKGLNR